jgi:isopenicillin-N N-acyltransferase-like protein
MNLPVITATGSAASRGEAHGRQAADRIERGLAMYRDEFARKGVQWDEAQALARAFMPHVEHYDADLVVELEAIAKGARQTKESILILNARTELLFWKELERTKAGAPAPELVTAEECTSATALPEVTANGHLLHGQNWDWEPRCADHAIALRIKGSDIPDSVNFVEAGQLARHGFNSEGVAITANGLHSAGDYAKTGVPNPFIRRKILSAETFGKAIGVIHNSARSFSHNLSLSHALGEAFDFETTPDHVFWIEPQDGILAHANHFRSPQARVTITDVNLARCPESLYRESRVRRGLLAEKGRIDVDTFKRVFGDTFGKPDSVLRSPQRRPGGITSATVYTLIMDTTERRAWVALRPYDGASFQEVSLA